MGVENHYTQKLADIKGARLTSDFVRLAGRLFDAASHDGQSDLDIPQPTHFSDNPEETQLYWRVGDEHHDHEFFQVHLVGRSILIALQHRHLDEPEAALDSGSTFIDQRKTVLVVGNQRPVIYTHDGIGPGAKKDALSGRETDTPTFRHRGEGIILPAFRTRLDHTMAVIGIHESAPAIHESIPDIQDLLLAS